MRLKTTGNALLIFAFLLSAAGIAEPSSGLSAAAAALLLAGFAIVTMMSHSDWSAGYRDAQLDMTFRDPAGEHDTGLFKCGMSDCYCSHNPVYLGRAL